MIKGGYQIINLKEHNFADVTDFSVKGIYDKVNIDKPILINFKHGEFEYVTYANKSVARKTVYLTFFLTASTIGRLSIFEDDDCSFSMRTISDGASDPT